MLYDTIQWLKSTGKC